MLLLDALRRATSMTRKGDRIALIPASGGLPPHVAIKTPGLSVAWLIDIDLKTSAMTFETSDLQLFFKQVKPNLHHDAVIMGLNGQPISLNAGGHFVPATPLIHAGPYFHPFPMTELKLALKMESVLRVLHAAPGDDLRPVFDTVRVESLLAFCGSSTHLALAKQEQPSNSKPGNFPVRLFWKWPSGGLTARYVRMNKQIYMGIGDELRVVPEIEGVGWDLPTVDEKLEIMNGGLVLDVEKKALLEPFKTAKKISERRVLVLGISHAQPWVRFGGEGGAFPIPGVVHDVTRLWQCAFDGDQFLDVVKATTGDMIRIIWNPFVWAPLGFIFSDCSACDLLWPLIPLQTEKHT